MDLVDPKNLPFFLFVISLFSVPLFLFVFSLNARKLLENVELLKYVDKTLCTSPVITRCVYCGFGLLRLYNGGLFGIVMCNECLSVCRCNPVGGLLNLIHDLLCSISWILVMVFASRSKFNNTPSSCSQDSIGCLKD